MAHDYVQIPPDSTGKKIRHTKRIDLEVNTVLIDLATIDIPSPVVGLTSGATGHFLGYTVKLGLTYIYVAPTTGTFQSTEIITINGTNSATISTLVEQNTSNVVLTDSNTALNTLAIDDAGAAYIRYAEGNLGFDAFGLAQFSQKTQVESHFFTYGDTPNSFYDDAVIGASVTSSIQDSSIVLSTGITSGSRITRTTHQYYPYNPGEGNEVLLSYRCGDNGKENVVRRWGLFDDEDGIFFELNETTFRVGIRSSTSGTPVDILIDQDDFNGDQLDTANINKFVLDVSKYNIFWMDYQWLGTGIIRFGAIAPDGTRITIHTVQNPNSLTVPYIRRGTLPLRLEQFNIGLAASTSESRMVCASILRQNHLAGFAGEVYSYSSNLTNVSSSVYVPIISSKPLITHKGQTNRITFIPTDLEVSVVGDPIYLNVLLNPGLTGATYSGSAADTSGFLIDTDATATISGTIQNSLLFGVGVTHREFEENLINTLKLSADGVSQPIFSIQAKTVTPGGNSQVALIVRWKEAV